MDIQTLKMVLAATPNSHTVMLKGPHGIGKTEVIRWLAKNVWHQDCIEFQASQISDVGDLIGLPRINSETGETEFVPPYWYKKDEHGNPLPVTLFLDEINRGTTLVTNAMMQLGLDHKILNFKLAPGSHVICAINPGDDGNYDVEEFDPAKMDRFVVYNFTPETQEWIDWAIDVGINSLVTGYISQFGSDLDQDTKDRLAQGERIVEVLKQSKNSPMDVEKQVVMIYAVVNNYLKDIPVSDVREFENDLLKEIEESHPDIFSSITQTKELTAENEQAIKEILKSYVEKFLKSK